MTGTALALGLYLLAGLLVAFLLHPWGWKTYRVAWIHPGTPGSRIVATALVLGTKTVFWPLYLYLHRRFARRLEAARPEEVETIKGGKR